MYRKLFILIILVQTQEKYKDPRCINLVDHKEMIDKVKSSMVYKSYLNHSFFDDIKNQYKKELMDFLTSDNEDRVGISSLYYNLDYYFKMVEYILNLILKDEYNPKLILLLVLTDHTYCKTPGSFSVISVFVSSLIREILGLSFNETYILNNKEEWKKFLTFNKKYIHLKLPEVENMQGNEDFMKFALESIVFNELRLLNKSICQIMDKSNVKNTHKWANDDHNNEKISIKSTFYEFINEYIYLQSLESYAVRVFSYLRNTTYTLLDLATNSNNEKLYYIMVSSRGFKYNRISSEVKENLYKRGKYNFFFSSHPYSRLQSNGEMFAFKSLEDETFRFKECIGFEFFMGLLQHYAELTSKEVLCSYAKKTHDIKIIKTR